MPRCTVAARRAISSSWASFCRAPSRLTWRPSASPAQPSYSASAMRPSRLPRISSMRPRCAGAGAPTRRCEMPGRPLRRLAGCGRRPGGDRRRPRHRRRPAAAAIARRPRAGGSGPARGCRASLRQSRRRTRRHERPAADRRTTSQGCPWQPTRVVDRPTPQRETGVGRRTTADQPPPGQRDRVPEFVWIRCETPVMAGRRHGSVRDVGREIGNPPDSPAPPRSTPRDDAHPH